MRKTSSFTMATLLVGLDILFSRFLFVYTPGNIDRISLQFIPNAFAGFLFGPLYGALILAAGDVLGMLVNSVGLPYSPLFTFSALLRGLGLRMDAAQKDAYGKTDFYDLPFCNPRR